MIRCEQCVSAAQQGEKPVLLHHLSFQAVCKFCHAGCTVRFDDKRLLSPSFSLVTTFDLPNNLSSCIDKNLTFILNVVCILVDSTSSCANLSIRSLGVSAPIAD